MSAAAEELELHRRHLTGLAYRMLGSVSEAEDVVQDAFLRWAAEVSPSGGASVARSGTSVEHESSVAVARGAATSVARGGGSVDHERAASDDRGGAGSVARGGATFVDRGGAVIESPRAYLSRVVTRLCLDRLKSARARREQYVGTWLPDPLVSSGQAEELLPAGRAPGGDQAAALALAEDLSVALLVTLETLSPLERAAFLLHDVFDMEFAEIAGVLDRSEAAVRQLAARARAHVKDGKPRYTPSPEAGRIAEAFHGAMLRGELATLTQLLAEDAVLYSDGGGKRRAALNPIFGRLKILRFFLGIARKWGAPDPSQFQAVLINGMPGFLVHGPEGLETMAFEIVDGRVTTIYAVRNPDKLRHLS